MTYPGDFMNEKIGVGFKTELKIRVSDQMIRQFAEMSGDFNPIHLDDNYAATTRFKQRIAHGMISGALISSAIANKIGQGTIYLGQTLKFVNPVFVDEEIIINLEVLSIREDKGIATITTLVSKNSGEIVVKGEATVMLSQFV